MPLDPRRGNLLLYECVLGFRVMDLVVRRFGGIAELMADGEEIFFFFQSMMTIAQVHKRELENFSLNNFWQNNDVSFIISAKLKYKGKRLPHPINKENY